IGREIVARASRLAARAMEPSPLLDSRESPSSRVPQVRSRVAGSSLLRLLGSPLLVLLGLVPIDDPSELLHRLLQAGQAFADADTLRGFARELFRSYRILRPLQRRPHERGHPFVGRRHRSPPQPAAG